MKIFRQLTVKNLKKNKTRTLVTIIGIILSTSMFCAVTTFAASLQQMLLDHAIDKTGDYYGSLQYITAEQVAELRQRKEITRMAVAKQLGYGILEDCVNVYKPYLCVLAVEDGFAGQMSVHLTQGRLPETDSELLIPEHLQSNGGVKLELGQTLTLELGGRVDSDGYEYYQNTAYLYDGENEPLETLEVRETKEYTVVGFYERPDFESFSAPGYSALTVLDPGELSANTSGTGENLYCVYLKTRRPSQIYELLGSYDAFGKTNSEVLRCMGLFGGNGYGETIYGFALVVMFIIMFGAVSLIYNAFSISVSDRTKQYGLLASLGATKRQLKSSVMFEAAAVSVIGIPIGILCGIGGIGVTLLFLKEHIYAVIGATISLHVSWFSVAAASAVALITVLISAWIPAKRTAKIVPIEAIRQTEDVKVKPREVRIFPLTGRLFGIEGVIGAKYFKRDRKRYRATIISLTMSIFLFISASALTMYMTDSFNGAVSANGFELTFRVYGVQSEEEIEQAAEKLAELEGVTQVTYFVMGEWASVAFDRTMVSEEYIHFLESAFDEWHVEKSLSGEMPAYFSVIYLAEADYQKLAEEEGIDPEKLFSGEKPMALGFSANTSYVEKLNQYFRFQILRDATPEAPIFIEGINRQTDENGEWEYTPVGTHLVGGTIKNQPWFIDYYNSITLIYPIGAYEAIEEKTMEDCGPAYFQIKSSDHKATALAIEPLEDEWNGTVYDYAEDVESVRGMLLVVNVFAYGFITLISLIAVTNVFNTISTNVALRRREFAMLKSMGMERRGLQRMMNYECVLYGVRALIFGLPLSFAMTWVIYQITDPGYSTTFYLPWKAIILAVFSVFAVVFVTMMYAMAKIRNENPIDALKMETL